ncbi:hypothetical protein H1_105 [Efunavirus H1]|uniref:Uncharacterized protein n=1 Tax=Enterococcus phage H1 TaxID=2982918 RepID=A0AAE9P582_9CAUD|nr:hypothetical protein H1_105 [Enterococcus phage H1]
MKLSRLTQEDVIKIIEGTPRVLLERRKSEEGFTLGFILNRLARNIVVAEGQEDFSIYQTYQTNAEKFLVGGRYNGTTGFYIIAEKDVDGHDINISQSDSISNLILYPHIYTREEAKVVGMRLRQVINDLLAYSSNRTVEMKVDPYTIIQEGLLNYLMPKESRVIPRAYEHMYNNLTDKKIGDIVSPLYLSEEVRAGAPFSVKKSLEKIDPDFKLENQIGLFAIWSWSQLFTSIEETGWEGSSALNDLGVDRDFIKETLEKFDEDVKKHIVEMQYVYTSKKYMSYEHLRDNLAKYQFPTKMGPFEYGMVATYGGTAGAYTLVSIQNTPIFANPLHMKGFLQPATYEEAIDDLTIGNIISTEPYGQNEIVFDRANTSVSRYILNSLKTTEEEE